MNKRERGLANMVELAGLKLLHIELKGSRYTATAQAPNGKTAAFWVTSTGGDPRAEKNEFARMKRFYRDNPEKKQPLPGVPSTLPSPVAETRREFAPPRRTLTVIKKPAAPASPPTKPAPVAPAPQPTQPVMTKTTTTSAPAAAAPTTTKPKAPAKLDRKQFFLLGTWAANAAEFRGKGKTLADLCAIATAAVKFDVPQQAMTEALDLHGLKDVIAKPVKRTPNAVLADTLAALLLKLGDKVPAELEALTSKAAAEVAP